MRREVARREGDYLISTLIGSEFVGLLSMDSVEDAVNAGHLVEVVLDPSQRSEVALAAVERPIGFLRRADTTLSPVALALRDDILSLCIKLGYPLVANADAGNGVSPAAAAPSRRADDPDPNPNPCRRPQTFACPPPCYRPSVPASPLRLPFRTACRDLSADPRPRDRACANSSNPFAPPR
jgi:hypothetical protein